MSIRILLRVLLAACLFASGATVLAQQKCVDFRAILQHRLGPATVQTPAGPLDLWTWIGPTYVRLGTDQVIATITDFTDPGVPPPVSTVNEQWTLETGSIRYLDFGNGDALTLEGKATFKIPEEKVVWSAFDSFLQVKSGKGRFESATGTMVEKGMFMVWPTGDKTPPDGKYNATINGYICGVK